MNELLSTYWHWFIAIVAVFTLLGYIWLQFSNGKAEVRRHQSGRKEKSR